MPIYVYECPEHGKQDHLLPLRSEGPYAERPCNYVLRTVQVPAQPNWLIVKEKCKLLSFLQVSAPAIIDVKRDWNEKANEYQRNSYTQAKAQLENHTRAEAEHSGKPPKKVTEEAIQVTAQKIEEQKRRGPVSDEQHAANQFRTLKRATKKAKKNG